MILAFNALGNDGDVFQELVESIALIAVFSLGGTQCRGYRNVGLGIAAGAGDGHIVIHELHLIGAVISAVGGKFDLKPPYRFKVKFKVKFIGARENRG